MNKLKNIIFTILFTVSVVNAKASSTPMQITSFADIIEPLMPTVVNIYTVKYNEPVDTKRVALPDILPLDKFNNFFEQFNIPFSFQDLYNNTSVFALGSGVVVDGDGYIITNDHVVTGSDEVFVKLSDNTEIPARIIGTDPKTDLALLKIDVQSKLPFVAFADSSNLRVGDVVIAIGNPLGFGGTVTTGIISSKGRDLGVNQDELVDDFIQTDAAINTGNSGGPLFNIEGKVIGLNTALPEASGGTNIGIGFAIPSNTVQDIMKQLKEKGKISRGKLDISVQQVTPELVEALSLNKTYGVLVVNTKPGGAGDKAGLKRGDLITEFNDQQVLNSRKLQLFVADCHIGEKVNLTLVRDNKVITLVAEIEEGDSNKEEEREIVESIKISGVTFRNITIDIANKFIIDPTTTGVIVDEINPELGIDLEPGDIIMSIDQKYIKDTQQLNNIYLNLKNNKKRTVVLLVKRKVFAMFVAFPIR